ncbi:MAG: hypothetical protein V4772_23765, partial [Pseudomonadota bacterium]
GDRHAFERDLALVAGDLRDHRIPQQYGGNAGLVVLAALPGKSVFFLDTCYSGNVLGSSGTLSRSMNNDVMGVINELSSASSGVVVFSSSTGRQLSYENAVWGNGAFTKAVVEGLGGKANYQNTGRITHKMLDLYISERVKQLTGGKQSPVTQAPGGVADFPLAVVK